MAKKVCLISSMYPPRISGPSTQTRHFALLLKENGVIPVVVTFGERDEVRYNEGIKVYYLNAYEKPIIGAPLQYTNAFFRLWNILKEEKPDIIQHQTGVDYLAIISGFLTKIMGIPSIIKYAGDLVWERLGSNDSNRFSYEEIFNSSLKSKFLVSLERFALNNFTVIWATSRFQKESLTKILRIDERKIRSYPNYITLELNPPSKTVKDTLTILSVCRFARWKRIDNTLKAFARLKKENVTLKIVGGENPALEKELRELAANLGIQEKVQFEGSISPTKINEFFKDADIFISSTTYEPFGITFVEAMAAGLPIVATKTGGIPEVVPEGKAGFLVEPDNMGDMADKLCLLIDNFKLRERFGEYGKQWVRQYDLKEHLYIFLKLYQELEKSNKKPKKLFKIVENVDKKTLHNYYKNQQEDISRMYEDRHRQNKQKRRLEIIKEIINVFNNTDDFILDIGCGDGYASSYILNGYPISAYFGLDMSNKKLRNVLQKVRYSRVIMGDGENLPFADKSFSKVLCLETLEHLIDPPATIREIQRILKPGGIALISIPVDSPLQGLLIRIIKKIRRNKNSRFDEHIQLFTAQSINALLEECGLSVLTKRFCGFNFPLSNLILESLPYDVFSKIDNSLCRIPLQCFGIGTKFGLSFGREYAVFAVQKL